MYPEGQPVEVPRYRILKEKSEDGRAHWCGIVGRNGTAITRCAILPMQSVRLKEPGFSESDLLFSPIPAIPQISMPTAKHDGSHQVQRCCGSCRQADQLDTFLRHAAGEGAL